MSWVSWDKLCQPKADGGLGFKNIAAFNDALLAKLSWRLLSYPSAFVSRVLLGKYCFGSSLLHCQEKVNMSHGWRGVLIGRDVLKKGLGWVIGSGQNIKVWSDPWLSLTEPHTPMGPIPENMTDLRVLDLVDSSTGDWNWTVVREVLPCYEDCIRFMVRSSSKQEDRLRWLLTKNGKYTVKTGYLLISTEPSMSNNQGQGRFYWIQNVWKVNTSPKIKMFLWKSLAGALPVGSELAKRGMENQQPCKRCSAVETVDHLLLHCSFAQRVWELTPMEIPSFGHTPTMVSFLQQRPRLKNLPPTGLNGSDLYAFMCWSLWQSRNKLIFENLLLTEEETVRQAVVACAEWQKAHQCELKKGTTQCTHDLNHDVMQEDLICYVDASWKAELNSCGIGVVFRNNADGVERHFTDSKLYVKSPLEAEAFALKRGVMEAKTYGFTSIRFCSDSQILMHAMNSGEDRLEISNYLEDIKSLAARFHMIYFQFVPRTANQVADALAKKALTELVSGSLLF